MTNSTSFIIDRESIAIPTITLTQRAMDQLSLMVENDFTLAGKYFRIVISGKGCDGFTYSVGFTDKREDDFSIRVTNTEELEIIIDSFAAFYLGETVVDYIFEEENGNEGFTVTNLDQKKFHGKFWKKNKDLIPPQVNQ